MTFQNAQKITSDLDELTGDPSFRDSIRQLIEGLSGLVSSTQQVEQQVQVANTLDSMTVAVKRQGGIAEVGSRESGVGGEIAVQNSLTPHSSLLTPRTETPQWLLQLKESGSRESGKKLTSLQDVD